MCCTGSCFLHDPLFSSIALWLHRRAMAFQSGTMQRRCERCHEPGKFYQMYQSYREDHVWYQGEKPMSTLFCITCEVKNREEEWEKWNPEQKELAGGEGYPTIEAVRKDQKNRRKEDWHARSEPIRRGKKALQALRDHRFDEISVVSVNYAKCLEIMAGQDDMEVDQGGQPSSSVTTLAVRGEEEPSSSTTLAVRGAEHSGPVSLGEKMTARKLKNQQTSARGKTFQLEGRTLRLWR